MKFNLVSNLLIIILLSSCGFSDRGDSQLSIFRYNEPNGISSLDPAFSRNVENISAVNHLFNGLVQMSDELEIQPAIAKSWIISADRLTYTFNLRTDVKFHPHRIFSTDSDRYVNANDFVYSFSRLVDDDLAAPGAWVFNFVDRDSLGELAVSSLNDSTFQIKLQKPFPPFLGILTMQYCSVVPQEIVEYYGEDFRSNPIGTGPFRFKYWSESNKLVLLKNTEYFERDLNGKKLPHLDAINITFNKDEEVAFLQFLKGDLDYLSGLNGSYKDEILNSNGQLKEKYADRIEMITTPYLNTEYLGFNLANADIVNGTSPLSDVRVRKAINFGFDREKMLLYLRNGIGTPALQGFIPKGLPGFDNEMVGFSYQPDSARNLIKEAGYDIRNPLPTIVLNTTAQYLDLCEFIQHELKQVGVTLEIEVNPSGTHNELVANGELAFFRKSWIADYPDSENYLALFYSKNEAPEGPNYTHFRSDQFDALYNESLITNSDSIRLTNYRLMDLLIKNQSVVVPLFYDQVVRFIPQDVDNLGINPLNLLTLKFAQKPRPTND